MTRAGRRDHKRAARDLDELRKGLARNDAERAAAALLRLPYAERAVHVAEVGSLVETEIKRAHATKAWPELASWAARLDGEPRLVTVAAVRWALLWGALSSADFDRAGRLFESLEAEMSASAPRLTSAVRATITARNARPVEALSWLGLAEPDPDEARLGHEPVRARSPISPPSTADDVRGALAAAWAGRPWSTFAATASMWAGSSKEPVARAVRVEAALLAVHQALLRTRAARPRPLEPLSLLVEVGGQVMDAPEVADALFLALRLSLSRAEESGESAPVALLPALVKLLARDPTRCTLLRDMLIGLASGRHLSEDRMSAALSALHEVSPDASVWAHAIGCARERDRTRRHGHERPGKADQDAWVERALGTHLRACEPIVLFLRTAEPRLCQAVLSYIATYGDRDLATTLALSAWPTADDSLRSELLVFIRAVLQGVGGRYCSECGVVHAGDLESYADLDDDGRRIWERLEPVVLPYHPLFLRLALDKSGSPQAARSAVERYLGSEAPIERWVEAIAAARGRYKQLATSLRKRMVARFGGDVESLARGLMKAVSSRKTTGATAALSSAMLDAMKGSPRSTSDRVDRALVIAQRYAPRRRQTRARRTATEVTGGTNGPSSSPQQPLFPNGTRHVP